MMELKEDIDWLLSKNSISSSLSVVETPKSGALEEEEEEDYNPPSMETNVADLEEEEEEEEEREQKEESDEVDMRHLLDPRQGAAPRILTVPTQEEASRPSEDVFEEDPDDCLSSCSSLSNSVPLPGVVGLRNVGNTCYMNAGLQCLLSSPPLVYYFLSIWREEKEEEVGTTLVPAEGGEERKSESLSGATEEAASLEGGSISCSLEQSARRPILSNTFSSLLSSVWQGGNRVIKPSHFKDTLSCAYPQFKGSHQHDCQEFLALLLDSLHEELKALPRPTKTPSSSSPDSQSSSVEQPETKSHLSAIRSRPLPLHFQLPSKLNIEDYLKDNKTSNVNVNSPAHEPEGMNNALSFDSDKYPSKEKNRPEATINNLTLKTGKEEELRSGGKRFKETNLIKSSEGGGGSVEEDFNGMKRMRLDSSEKNVQHEWERNAGIVEDSECNSHNNNNHLNNTSNGGAQGASSLHRDSPPNASKLNETIEADRVWDKYIADNDTVIARNFHGQFKNKVVCSVCEHVSVTFEPFMYLSVPLPGALTRQVDLIFLGRGSASPLRMRINMTRVDNVGNLKTRLREILHLEESSKLQIVEVFHHHISRHVDDWTSLKFLKEDREIYALELMDTEEHFEEEENSIQELQEEEESLASQDYQQCIICKEDLPAESLRQHNACNSVICKFCMDLSIEHHQKECTSLFGKIQCPGCLIEADPKTEFVTLDKVGRSLPKKRMLNLPVLYRLDNSEEKDNNKKNVESIGHPFVLVVPNIVSGRKLYELLDPLVKSVASEEYTLVLVNAQGTKCARCIFPAHCYGCIRMERNSNSRIYLQPNDTIGISFKSDSVLPKVNSLKDHESMFQNSKIRDKLTLSDCLQAFSEKEVLDENNPWFCSECQKNQCATKTLTIWRFPDYLIIYLKRFVYLPGTSGAVKLETPVEFNLNNFELTEFLSGPMPEFRPRFDLYGVVNHFGSVCGGHYTSFTKKENQWNYFDDSSVTEKKVPGSCSGDFSSAYVLFYKRSGIPVKSLRQDISSRILTTKFNIDSPLN